MITSLSGTLIRVDSESAALDLAVGPLTCRVLIPAADALRWGAKVNEEITLTTLLYLESANQGATIIPRLLGFASPADRRFFELFTTVKGIGYRKALRAIALDPPTLARAIEDRDIATLTTLPEIGRRTAETIIAALHDKMGPVLHDAAAPAKSAPGRAAPDEVPVVGISHDAVTVLVQLGEPRHLARQWVQQAMIRDPELREVQAVVEAAFRFRES